MDMTWVTDRIALGGGIWNAKNMAELAQSGITHVIDMQIEFDDTPLAEPVGVRVLWTPTDDDFLPKPPELLGRGVASFRTMPIYEYRCAKCRKRFTAQQPISEHGRRRPGCPNCKSKAVEP